MVFKDSSRVHESLVGGAHGQYEPKCLRIRDIWNVHLKCRANRIIGVLVRTASRNTFPGGQHALRCDFACRANKPFHCGRCQATAISVGDSRRQMQMCLEMVVGQGSVEDISGIGTQQQWYAGRSRSVASRHLELQDDLVAQVGSSNEYPRCLLGRCRFQMTANADSTRQHHRTCHLSRSSSRRDQKRHANPRRQQPVCRCSDTHVS